MKIKKDLYCVRLQADQWWLRQEQPQKISWHGDAE